MDQQHCTSVIVFTAQHRISGNIALLPGARLTDYVMHAGPFMAISDVEVSYHDGRSLFQADFLDLSTSSIEIIMPDNAMQHRTEHYYRKR